MTVSITSTTDSPEAVTAAMGLAKSESKDVENSAPEAKEASEQKQASESEPEETEESEAADESEESEPEEGDDKVEASEKDKPRKKGGFQRRIDKLSSQKAELQREVEYLRSLALKSKDASEQKNPVVEKPKASEGKPNPDDFDTHTEYVEALTDWKTEQKFKAREEEQNKSKLQREHETLIKSHLERVSAFKEKTADYQDVVESVDDVPVSPVVEDLLISSENGPALIYELAKNREEFERINKLPPIAAARELGKLEARISSKTEKEPNKITKAPKPLTPVSAKGGSANKPLDEMDYQEYKRARELELKKRA